MTIILLLSGTLTLVFASVVARVAGLHVDSARPTGWRAWCALLVAHAGIALALAGLVAMAVPAAWAIAALVVVFAALWGLLHHPAVEPHLRERFGPTEPSLPVERHGYGLLDLRVLPGDRLAWKTIGESKLRSGGVLVLGVDPAGDDFDGVPGDPKLIRPGDTLMLYGPATRLHELLKHRRYRPDRSADGKAGATGAA